METSMAQLLFGANPEAFRKISRILV